MFGMARLCGTFGCTLPDMHKGLHEVKTSLPRKKKTCTIVRKEEVVDICYVDGEVVAASKTPIQSMLGLYDLSTSFTKISRFFGMVRSWMVEAGGSRVQSWHSSLRLVLFLSTIAMDTSDGRGSLTRTGYCYRTARWFRKGPRTL